LAAARTTDADFLINGLLGMQWQTSLGPRQKRGRTARGSGSGFFQKLRTGGGRMLMRVALAIVLLAERDVGTDASMRWTGVERMIKNAPFFALF
jgi:hypothetical protein